MPTPPEPTLSAAMQRVQSYDDTRELRLGVVCYGGVSLCIYMHGFTKELQKLVIASEAFREKPHDNPFDSGRVEHFYYAALQRLHDTERGGARTRVLVDVVAGTSAGGINGVFLSKALAGGLSQDPIRDLWFKRADINPLLGGKLAKYFNLVKFLFTRQPPFHGNAMYGWLNEALAEMGKKPLDLPAGGTPTAAGATLVPEGHALQLFVTATDYYGYPQVLMLAAPPYIEERRNRHILEFDYQAGARLPNGEVQVIKDQFGPAYDPVLAFAARATSSFPGAFPPQQLTGMVERLATGIPAARQLDWKNTFFSRYAAVGADPEDTCFIDGGVLNNYPFRPAIEAIVAKRAETEVDRCLLFVDADPSGDVGLPKKNEIPNLFGAVWAGLTGAGNKQPILDEIVWVREFNDRVEMTRRILQVPDARDFIGQEVRKVGLLTDDFQLPANLSQDELTEKRRRLERRAQEAAGHLYSTYVEIRVDAIVQQFAVGICTNCEYDRDLSTAFFVRLVAERWAEKRRLIGEHPDKDARGWLLEHFDLGYIRRRLAHLIAGINEQYKRPGRQRPTRAELNEVKAFLYDRIEDLTALMGGSGEASQLKERIKQVFMSGDIASWAKAENPRLKVETFVDDNMASLDELVKDLGEQFDALRAFLGKALYDYFQEKTASWDLDVRTEVLTLYLGFPFWDQMVYPINRLSHAGELKPIKVYRCSPSDSTALGLKNAKDKLKGVAIHHFGAFFKRSFRENDYLWGRLDAAERLLDLLWSTGRNAGLSPTGVEPALRDAPLGAVPGEELEEGAIKTRAGRNAGLSPTGVEPALRDAALGAILREELEEGAIETGPARKRIKELQAALELPPAERARFWARQPS